MNDNEIQAAMIKGLQRGISDAVADTFERFRDHDNDETLGERLREVFFKARLAAGELRELEREQLQHEQFKAAPGPDLLELAELTRVMSTPIGAVEDEPLTSF
jgi:hypothetical protein